MTIVEIATDTATVPGPATVWDGISHGYIPAEPPRIHPSVVLHCEVADDVDTVTLEVIRYALMNVNLEHADLLQRLSLSPVVMQARDFQTSLLTEVADVVFLGAGVQYFSNQNALTIKYILEHRGRDGIRDGDMFLCNDPFIGASHQSDVSITAPVFVDGKIFCWLSNAIHYQDVGGPAPGSLCTAAEDAFQEPMAWPPTRVVEDGALREDLEHLFVRQSRYPGMCRMDLRAGIGALEASKHKIAELVTRYGAPALKHVMHRVLDAGEQLFVERLAAIPDGRWSHRAPIEAALPGDRNTYFYQVNITKLGDRLIVDNEGTDPQTGSINLTFAGFAGCVQAALTMQMLPEQAGAYGGAYRRVDFRLVPGLLNCADPPAAVSSSGAYSVMSNLNVAATAVCKMLASGNDETRDLILGAPTPNLSTLIGGGVLSDGEQFIIIESNGLMGSLAGRASRDGVDVGGEWWIPDALGLNSEDLEAQTPFVVLTRELLPVGTDGAGRFRSGVGFRETLAARGIQGAQMFVHSNESFPRGIGLFGGNPGSIATCRVKNATDLAAQFAAGRLPRILNELNGVEQVVDYKGAPIGLADFDVIEWTSPGAAGYGDPLLRDPALVLADFEARMIDHDAAARVYGVVLAGDSGAVRVDDVATSMARCTLLTKRLDGHEPGAQVQPPGGARRVGELLHVVDGRWWCNGADLGAEDEDYRRTALTRDTPTRQLGPEFDSVDGEMADRFVLREYLCPVTGYRIDTELIACPERARG